MESSVLVGERLLVRARQGSDLVQECQYLAAARIADFRGSSVRDFRAWLAGILDRRVVRAVGAALRLLERMTGLGWGGLCQDAVGLHRFQGASPAEIAGRLRIPEE